MNDMRTLWHIATADDHFNSFGSNTIVPVQAQKQIVQIDVLIKN